MPGPYVEDLWLKSPLTAGNLVDMGKLAFAPATPEVLKLAAHLGKTHEFFDESFHGVFRYDPLCDPFPAW